MIYDQEMIFWYVLIASIGGIIVGGVAAVLLIHARNAAKDAEYRARLEERDRQLEEQRRLLDPQSGQLKHTLSELLGNDFERLANRVIDEKTRSFSEQSDRSLRQLLEPFRQQIADFKQQHELHSHRSTKDQQQLLDQITQLGERSGQLSVQAEQLTRALRGDNKAQGDWGEVSLQRLLEQLGLSEGREYETQVHIPKKGEGEDGGEGRLRADVVLHLPQERVVIIDAKVSLTAYTRLIAATTDEERAQANREHAESMKRHIKELGAKRYQYHWKVSHPQNSVEEYIYMFVPIEGAIEAAFRTDRNLPQYAQEQKVIIVNPIITIVLLEALKNMWRIDRQHNNIETIYIEAGKIYDKCANFIESMEKIGKHLNQTNNEYDKAVRQLHDGRGSMVSAAKKLKDLGAHTKKEIPEHERRELL